VSIQITARSVWIRPEGPIAGFRPVRSADAWVGRDRTRGPRDGPLRLGL